MAQKSPEEFLFEKKKQLMILRQNAFNRVVELFLADKLETKKFDFNVLMAIAETFVQDYYLMGLKKGDKKNESKQDISGGQPNEPANFEDGWSG